MARAVGYYWLVDLLLFFVVVAVEAILLVAKVQPLMRSFDCHDPNIQKPLKPQSVSLAALCIGVFATAIAIGVCEGLRHTLLKSDNQSDDQVEEYDQEGVKCGRCVPWQRRVVYVVFMYNFGAMVTFLFTDICKLMVGRFRPNFLALCSPQQMNCTQELTDAICTRPYEIVYQGRRSFPSGHASISTFCMVYLALYLEAFIRTRRTNLLKPFLQLVAISVAVYCSLSRVFDYWHHLTDVLAGMAIGTLVAVFLVFKPLEMFAYQSSAKHRAAAINNNGKHVEEARPIKTDTAELSSL